MVRPGLAILALVVGSFGLAWVFQRWLIYFPSSAVPQPEAVGLPGVEQVRLRTADGLELGAWFLPSDRQPAAFTVIVFNGNAGNRAFRAPLATALARRGMSVLLFDYRGYGENMGVPSESGLAMDARAARAYLDERRDVSPGRIVYFGESLGGAVAIALATERPPFALILRSPFTSLTAIGQFHYPWLPVRLLLRDRFTSLDRVRQVRSPVLVIAGDRDAIVPLEDSRRLYETAPKPKQWAVIAGADHNDDDLLAGKEMLDAVESFLRRLTS
jgi:fermentation-respiration switch protein FrsA (DUF1100 family)